MEEGPEFDSTKCPGPFCVEFVWMVRKRLENLLNLSGFSLRIVLQTTAKLNERWA